MIAAMLGLPLAALLAALALLLLAAWCIALALAAGNGPDDDGPTDPQRERQRVDSIRAELDALDQADDAERQRNVVWLSPGAARRRVRAGTTPPSDLPGDAHRINVDVWSQP